MKVHFLIYIITISIICFGCKKKSLFQEQENVISNKNLEKTEIELAKIKEIPEGNIQDTLSFLLDNNFKIKLNGKVLSIFNLKEELVTMNNNIVRLKDENKNCFSEGFDNIIVNNEFFTIEQQNCSNRYFINEYVTFKYDSASEEFLLSKLGYQYIDKVNPNKEKPDKIFTKKDFGLIKLEDLDLHFLYIDLISKK